MTEALKVVIRYLFEETETHRINAYHHLENPASGRVMEKAGMRYLDLKSKLIDHEIKQFPYYEIIKKSDE